ncbi:MAG: hypothetical protein ACXVLQ_01825 [Bacteriovorax sp.]
MKEALKIVVLAVCPLIACANSLDSFKGVYTRTSGESSFCVEKMAVSQDDSCENGIKMTDASTDSIMVSYCQINGGAMSSRHGTDEHGGQRTETFESKFDGEILKKIYIAKDRFLGISKVGEMKVDSIQLIEDGKLHYQIVEKSASGPFSYDTLQFDCVYKK